jgi:hypothetical protein
MSLTRACSRARTKSGIERRRCDERNRDLRRGAAVGVRGGGGLQDAADEARDGRIRLAKNVSGMRVDYATGAGSLPGVRESLSERSGGAAGSRAGLAVRLDESGRLRAWFCFGNARWGDMGSIVSRMEKLASNQQVEETAMSVFDEKYRVVRVEADRLLLRGVHSGEVVTILNSEPEIPLTQEEYPVGKLIALTDPSGAPLN